MDTDAGNSLMYLPLDRLMSGGAGGNNATRAPVSNQDTSAESTTRSNSRLRDSMRSREVRR